ncbi:sulfotransferase [Bradyrhizobium sp. Pha-3]|uniref:sulfotransferase n=1 Tax=Bradyrhizobium sp. Pha-3 TaxID=208375 RepID=UPI0035D41C38
MMSQDLPRHLAGLTSLVGKDIDQERLLEEVNGLVTPLQRELEATSAETQEPIVFILGPPRSATTLVSQLLQVTGAFSVITNLAAKFWMAPAFGLMLSSALIPKDEDRTHSFRSTRGSTQGLWEPHEFGYFWSRWFDLGQETHFLDSDVRRRIDAKGLIGAVRSMQAATNRPIVFKNNTWFSFQADLLADLFPHAVFVSCSRDAFFVAQSLWLQRLDLFGEPSGWWSVKPPDYAEIVKLPPLEQVARQAVSIEATTRDALRKVDPARVIEIEYERVSREPRKIISDIAELIGRRGGEALKVDIEKCPSRFESTDLVRLNDVLAGELQVAIGRWRTELGEKATRG